jgi:hypothetical protein
LRDYITAIKHGRIHPFTLTERRVREATRNDGWYVCECFKYKQHIHIYLQTFERDYLSQSSTAAMGYNFFNVVLLEHGKYDAYRAKPKFAWL